MNKYINRTRSWWTGLKWSLRIGVILIAIVVAFSISSTIKNIIAPPIKIVKDWVVVEKPVVKYKTIVKKVPVEVIKEKEKVIEKFKLPDWARDKEVIGPINIAPSESKTEVAVLLDPQSGKPDFVTRQLPRPFLDFRRKFSIGIDYSPFHSSSLGDWRITGEWEAGRVWNIKPMIRGEVDQKGVYRISAGLKYEW